MWGEILKKTEIEQIQGQVFAALDDLTAKLHAAIDAGNWASKVLFPLWMDSLNTNATGQNDLTSSSFSERLMTADEVAEYVGLTRETIYEWAKDNRIPHLKLNGELRFRRSALDAWMEPNKDKIETAITKARRCDKVKPLFPAANR